VINRKNDSCEALSVDREPKKEGFPFKKFFSRDPGIPVENAEISGGDIGFLEKTVGFSSMFASAFCYSVTLLIFDHFP